MDVDVDGQIHEFDSGWNRNQGWLHRNIDDHITKYLPVLAGSAYQGVDGKRFASDGLLESNWDETYTNPASDRRRNARSSIGG